MNLSIEMRERLKQVAIETKQLQADIVALGGVPVEPEKPPAPPPATARTNKGHRPSAEAEIKTDAMDTEPTGRGRRKSKGRKR